MDKVLFSSYWRQGTLRHERVLSVMPIMYGLTEEEADILLSAQLAQMAPPDAIHFVGTNERLAAFRTTARTEGSPVRERILRAIRRPEGHGEAVLFISFDENSGYHVAETLDGQPVVNTQKLETERRRTLTDAFIRAGGEERAPEGVHFAKTSHSHSDRFLRVSRVFERTAHVHLVAFWLLPHFWRVRPAHVVLDTSSIHTLASIGSDCVRSRLAVPPLIWSHKSHSGVNTLPSEAVANGLFLISASTSGGLAQRLIDKGVTPDRIVTCFSLLLPGASAPGYVICDLLDHGFGGLAPIGSRPADQCALCMSGSLLVQIEGDQFNLSPPTVEQVLIEAKDLDTGAKSLLSTLAGRRAFRLYRRDAVESRTVRDIWVDATTVLNGSFARKAKALEKSVASWRHSVSQAATVDLTTVVASDYAGSDYLANQSLIPYRATLGNLRSTNPRNLSTLSVERNRASVVIASAVDREDEFISVSRTMRSFQPDGATYYLTMFSLFPTATDRESFASTLTYGSHGRQTFRLDSLFRLNVQVDRNGGAWRREIDALRRMVRWADQADVDVPQELEARISLLERGISTGLVEDAFWPSPARRALQLRSDFTLLEWSLEEPAVTPADLYVLFSVVLNNLRQLQGKRSLRQNAYHRAVLSPKVFDRFSDGIVQASILRACKLGELAYATCGQAVSAAMRQLLCDMIANGLNDPKAEGLNEFLVALCTGILSLADSDLEMLLVDIEQKVDLRHAVTAFFAKALKRRSDWHVPERTEGETTPAE
jgi:hypothetical protein